MRYLGCQLERGAVDGSAQHERRDHTAHGQPGHERSCVPMAMGNRRPQSFTAWGATMGARHVGFRPGLIDEDQPFGIEIGLAVEPVLSFLQNVRAVLFAGVRGLFCA